MEAELPQKALIPMTVVGNIKILFNPHRKENQSLEESDVD